MEESRLDRLKKAVEDEIALIDGERVVACNPPEKLLAEMRELSAHIEAAEKKIGSRDELTRKNTQVQTRLAKIKVSKYSLTWGLWTATFHCPVSRAPATRPSNPFHSSLHFHCVSPLAVRREKQSTAPSP